MLVSRSDVILLLEIRVLVGLVVVVLVLVMVAPRSCVLLDSAIVAKQCTT